MAKKRTKQGKEKADVKKVKASFHLPTETNPDPKTGTRETLDEEIDLAIQEVEEEWGGSSFEGFYVPGAGSYRMKQGPLAGEMVVDIYRRFFVTFDKKGSKKQISKLETILDRFRKSTDKNGKYPVQESIYLEVQELLAVHFVGGQ
jgi:hypothetical protein